MQSKRETVKKREDTIANGTFFSLVNGVGMSADVRWLSGLGDDLFVIFYRCFFNRYMMRSKMFPIVALLFLAALLISCEDRELSSSEEPVVGAAIQEEVIELNWSYALKDLYYLEDVEIASRN